MLADNKDDDKVTVMVLFTFSNHMNLACIYQTKSHKEVGTKITFIFTFNCWTCPVSKAMAHLQVWGFAKKKIYILSKIVEN